MLYGYAAAVIAGFLLTAIPNWTGRLPVNGAPLATLFALWLAGRLAVLVSAKIGPPVAATIDVAFLVALAAVAFREIVAGHNWRNLRVLAVVGVLIAGNVMFHVEAAWRGYAQYGARLGLAAIILLIALIGGRIVPSFTRNWLARRPPGRMPAPFGRFDALCIGFGAVGLGAWVAAAEHAITGVLLLTGGVLHAGRLARWAGERTTSDRLVLVLHVGYAFVPLGFLLAGAAVFWSAVPPGAAVHAWGAGAIATMTLAVMTRASLGHTGRPLAATPGTQLIYGLVVAAALLRIVAAFEPSLLLYHAAAFAWIAAFGGFVVSYGPLLIGMQPVWSRRS
jgi:uncharacterized protein involved in response to NO